MDARETAEYNRSIYPEFLQIFREELGFAGCWFTQGGNIYLTPFGSDFAIAEMEGPGDYIGIAYAIDQGWLPDCSLAVITNFSTIDTTEAKKLVDAGFSCLTEAYLNESANLTPDRLDFTARQLGWPTSQPVAGVYPVGGQPLPDYSQWEDWPMADYLLEYVI